MKQCHLFVVAMLAATVVARNAFAADAVQPARVSETVVAFIGSNCVRCHGPDEQNASLRFDDMPVEIRDEATAQRWQDILDVLNLDQMPPKNARQPSKESLSNTLETLTANLADARNRLTDSGGQVVLRRLNRREYNQTVQAMFGLPVDVSLLPEDGAVDRFDTVGQAHGFSSLHLEQYLKTARSVLDLALPSKAKRKRRGYTHTEQPEQRALRDIGQIVPQLKDRILKHQEPKHRAAKLVTETEVALSEQFLARKENQTGALIPFRGLNPSAEFRISGTPVPGDYRVRVRCGVVVEKGNRQRTTYLKVVRGEFRSRVPDAIDYYQVTGTIAAPQVIEFTLQVDNFRSNRLSFQRRHTSGPMLKRFGEAKDYHFRYREVASLFEDKLPDIWIDRIEVNGPLESPAPPLGSAELLKDVDLEKANQTDAEEIIKRFVFELFRRQQPSEKYVDKLIAIFAASRAHGSTFVDALKDALVVPLASPRFLYLYEPVAESGKTGRRRISLTARELAVRLAYFLWSAPPDEELYRLAADRKLLDKDVLAQQVGRMIASPRSQLFVKTFTSQWLELDRLAAIDPTAAKDDAYDDAVHRQSKQEVFALFQTLLYENEPVTQFIDSDYVVVNSLLAEFYGLPATKGDAFRKVKLPAGSVRGGLLGQSAILTLTGTGQRTSPVERGVFVLRKLLNRPPPPAPANVPMLDEESVGERSIRETLAAHMTKAQCNSCHRRIDPLGFALENFDPMGKWRTATRSSDGVATFPIETAGLMPDGKRQFKDVQQMKQHLLEDRDAFLTGLTKALMTYATGRTIGFSDQTQVASIAQQTAGKGYGLRTLIQRIVASDAFLTK